MTEQNVETPKEAPPSPVVDPGKTYTAAEVEALRANDKEAMSRLHGKAEKSVQELAALKESQEKAAKDAELAKLDEVARAKKINEELSAKLESVMEQRRQDLINNKIVLAAQREGALKPDQVLAVMGRTGIEISEDGTVTGVEESVAKFKEENAFHFGQARQAGGPPQGEMVGRDLPKTLEAADPESRMAARLERRAKIGMPTG